MCEECFRHPAFFKHKQAMIFHTDCRMVNTELNRFKCFLNQPNTSFSNQISWHAMLLNGCLFMYSGCWAIGMRVCVYVILYAMQSIHYNLHLENSIIHPFLDFTQHLLLVAWYSVLSGERSISIVFVVSAQCACDHYNHTVIVTVTVTVIFTFTFTSTFTFAFTICLVSEWFWSNPKKSKAEGAIYFIFYIGKSTSCDKFWYTQLLW